MRTINDLVEEIKSREKLELIDALYKHGKAVDEGFEVRFEAYDRPIIACYIGDEPCDFIVSRALVTHNGYVYLDGRDKNDSYTIYKDIEPCDVFAGHLSYVTESVVNSK